MLKLTDLQKIVDQLSHIQHLKRIRIHTRIPIVAPDLIKYQFIKSRLPLILVTHCNHPNEINSQVADAIARLAQQKITILNQTVLLKKVNNSSEVLVRLSEKLFTIGVMPYYLHLLDKVKGAAHFYLDELTAQKLYWEMQQKLPGYLVPKLVKEQQDGKKYL